jgi:O-antigen ligase
MAGRLAITEATVRSWRLRPLLGQGAGSTNGLTVISDSGAVFKKPWNGNITLFVLHDSGLVGLAALAALLAVTAAAGGRAVRRDRRAGEGSPTGPLLAAGLALLFAYQFTHGLWLMYPYVYLGLLAASTRPRVPASAGRAMPWSRERVPRPFPVERPGRR